MRIGIPTAGNVDVEVEGRSARSCILLFFS